MNLTTEHREFLAAHAAEWQREGCVTQPDGGFVLQCMAPGVWAYAKGASVWQFCEPDRIAAFLANGPDLASPAVCGILADWLKRKWCTRKRTISTVESDVETTVRLFSGNGKVYAIEGYGKGQAILCALMWAYTSPDSPVREG